MKESIDLNKLTAITMKKSRNTQYMANTRSDMHLYEYSSIFAIGIPMQNFLC